MWQAHSEPLSRGQALRFTIERSGQALTHGEALQRWSSDAAFRSFCTQTLAETPYTAFRWETPSVSAATRERPFEFVVLDAPGLQRAPDLKSFAEHFSASEDVVAFPSLGKDSTLIVPSPRGPAACYVHFASFLRQAPPEQIDALWSCIGSTVEQRLGSSPVWLSTAGGGVAWLHVRLDQRPKYYWHGPYRDLRP